MSAFVVVQGRLCDPRHIELDHPVPVPEGQVEVFLRSLQGGDLFWEERTVEQLAAEQGILGPQPFDRVVGQGSDLWADDQEFSEFLQELRVQRQRAGLETADE